MKRVFLASFLLFCVIAGNGQSILNTGTSVVMESGTVLSIPNQDTLQLLTGSSFENNGLIRLTGSAALNESVGNPIFGSGTEISRSFQNGPLSGLDVGGLGMTLTQATSLDSLIVVRGHTALLDASGQAGVKRWYDVEADNWNTPGDIGIYLDNSELNALAQNNLTLNREDANGNWVIIPGAFNANSVYVANSVIDMGRFTLFSDSLNSVIEFRARPTLSAWPNPSSSEVLVQTSGNMSTERCVLRDLSGKLVELQVEQLESGGLKLNVANLPAGTYLLEVPGHIPFKLMKL